MNIEFDFSDQKIEKLYPNHGWSNNSQGLQLLWLPILRLVNSAPEVRKSKDCHIDFTHKQWGEIRSFVAIISNLCLALRELHKLCRLSSQDLESESKDKFNISQEATTMIPLYVDIIYTYLRRAADNFMKAIRYVLFQHFSSAPCEFKNMIKLMQNANNIKQLVPLCDIDRLENTFHSHCFWFSKLRGNTYKNGTLKKGIRDIMEHHSVSTNVQFAKSGDSPWQVMVSLGHPAIGNHYTPDLIKSLRFILEDLCFFWTGICTSTDYTHNYKNWTVPYGDAIIQTGKDSDTIGFWPQL